MPALQSDIIELLEGIASSDIQSAATTGTTSATTTSATTSDQTHHKTTTTTTSSTHKATHTVTTSATSETSQTQTVSTSTSTSTLSSTFITTSTFSTLPTSTLLPSTTTSNNPTPAGAHSTATPTADWTKPTLGARASIAGIVSGVLAGLVLIALLTLFCLRHRQPGRTPLLPAFLRGRGRRGRRASADRVYPESAWLYDASPSPPRRGAMRDRSVGDGDDEDGERLRSTSGTALLAPGARTPMGGSVGALTPRVSVEREMDEMGGAGAASRVSGESLVRGGAAMAMAPHEPLSPLLAGPGAMPVVGLGVSGIGVGRSNSREAPIPVSRETSPWRGMSGGRGGFEEGDGDLGARMGLLGSPIRMRERRESVESNGSERRPLTGGYGEAR